MRAPRGMQLVALVLALCFVAGAVGWRIGQGTDPSAGSADIGFLQDMTTHHEQAILMSTSELLNGDDRTIKVFADEIVRFQSYELGLMQRDLERLGSSRYDLPADAMGWMGDPVPRNEMPGLASEEEMDLLDGDDGGDVDAAFVTMMIDHHAAGAAMAEAAAEDAEDERVRGLATRMARTQRSEIAELLRAAERGGLELPAPGVAWDVYEADQGAGMTHG